MKENIIIKSERVNVKLFRNICILLGVVLFVVFYIYWCFSDYSKLWNADKDILTYFTEYVTDTFTDTFYLWWNLGIPALFFVIPAFFGFLIYAWLSKVEIIVTPEHVYGTAPFGKRVDLPLDSVSAIGTGWLNSISVSTSSGRISFFAIKNRGEIHDVISKLLIERQHNNKAIDTSATKQEDAQSVADELKKYKELLDSGIITQEEFDAKKKQLLGL